MKKKISSKLILVLLLLAVLIACKKLAIKNYEDQLIQEFIESKDFQNNELLSCNSIDYENSQVFYVNNDKNKPVINLIFIENGKIISSVEAIKNSSPKIKLPNEGNFFMLYRDLKQFDLNKVTGKIELFDLNFDNHYFGSGEIVQGHLISKFYNPVSSNILSKYADVINFNKRYIDNRSSSLKIYESKSASLPCDSNNNGNISYSECYKCFITACSSNETCSVMCYFIGDALGGVLSPVKIPWCQASIAASCIYISLAY